MDIGRPNIGCKFVEFRTFVLSARFHQSSDHSALTQGRDLHNLVQGVAPKAEREQRG